MCLSRPTPILPSLPHFFLSPRGVLREGDTVHVSSGECEASLTTVLSVHRNRVPCRVVKAGQYATLALKDIDKTLVRKVRR